MLTDKWILAGIDILRVAFTIYIFSFILTYFFVGRRDAFKQL